MQQHADGSWSGPGTYPELPFTLTTAWFRGHWQNCRHTLTKPPIRSSLRRTNLDWVLSHFRPNGWVDGINLQGPSHVSSLHRLRSSGMFWNAPFSAVAATPFDIGRELRRGNCLRRFETNKCTGWGSYNAGFQYPLDKASLVLPAMHKCPAYGLRLFEITRRPALSQCRSQDQRNAEAIDSSCADVAGNPRAE
jgi:hypothetical protein